MAHIVVQKYGGTSVGDLERIHKVAARVARTVEQGHKVAVTVSAMGRTTDALVSLAKEISPRPDRRELDMLMATGEQQSVALLTLTLHKLGVRARSFTGQQAGFLTDSVSGGARIVEVNPELKWADTSRRGYMTVTLTPQDATSEWLFLETIRDRNPRMAATHRMRTRAGRKRLELV